MIISHIKKNISLFLIILLVLSTVGCRSKVLGHEILGVWEHDGNIIEFCTDGYVKKGSEKYEFSVANGKVTIDQNGEAMILDYVINSNGTMTMNGLIYYPVTR